MVIGTMSKGLRHACTALSAIALVLTPSFAPATTVEAVTFEELVKSAERIFVGEVVAVESFRSDIGRGPRIRTRVTFSIADAIRSRGVVSVLEFLGGTVGDLTQEVAGMPHFVVGEHYVVFARGGERWVNPVVGFTQGLLRVSRGARDRTARRRSCASTMTRTSCHSPASARWSSVPARRSANATVMPCGK